MKKASVLFAACKMSVAAIVAIASVVPSTAFTSVMPAPIIGKDKSRPWALEAAFYDEARNNRVVPPNGMVGEGRRRALCFREYENGDAITRGRFYDILNRTDGPDYGSEVIQIVDDNGRTDWYDAMCFEYGRDSVAVLTNITMVNIRDDWVTAWLVLSNGMKRSCDFCTPKHLFGRKRVSGQDIPFHCCEEHTIVVEELSEDVIKEVLHYMDSQGELEESTECWGHVDEFNKGTEAVNVSGANKTALCIREYRPYIDDVITRGRFYDVYETRNDKYGDFEMRIVDDKGRKKWFSTFYLDMEKEAVPQLTNCKIEDVSHPDDFLEVDLYFSDGTHRWCWVGTPQSFYRGTGDHVPGTNITFHDCPNIIVIRSDGIRAYDVEKVLHYIDGQGDLIGLSSPMDQD